LRTTAKSPKDEARDGEYRTKRVILKIYVEMAEAGQGRLYQTRLDPLPADPHVAHVERKTTTVHG
jgi:hypothetical protein